MESTTPTVDSDGRREPGAGGGGQRGTEDAARGQLVGLAVGERCATCSAQLASDQRYCVECGERRGKARFPVASLAASAPPPAVTPVNPPAPRERRMPSSATLVAGIATLLLAMGVGVEIGRLNTNGGSPRANTPAVQVVTLPGSGGGAAPTVGASTAAPPAASSKQTKAPVKAAATKPVSKTVVVHAGAAAAKVLGSAAPKQPTVQVGQSCSAGTTGCQNGKFNGQFFGP
jgi:hypothetical protein